MSHLLESIKIENNHCELLPFHLERIDKSYNELYSKPVTLKGLESAIDKAASSVRDDGVYKLRLLYNESDWHIEILPYSIREISSLQCIYDNTINYKYKFADRLQLDQLYKQRDTADDILIIKHGFVTDSYYANVAFYNGSEWTTPSNPLLEGTRRASLLKNKSLVLKDIAVSEIVKYQKVSLFNAMIDLGQITFPTQSILL